MENPYKLTKEEQDMMKEGWEKPVKKKVKQRRKQDKEEERVKLHLKHTVASKHKQKMSEELMEFL